MFFRTLDQYVYLIKSQVSFFLNKVFSFKTECVQYLMMYMNYINEDVCY